MRADTIDNQLINDKIDCSLSVSIVLLKHLFDVLSKNPGL